MMAYMYFVYALVAWAVCTALILILYCKKRRQANPKENDDEYYCNVRCILALACYYTST